MKCEPQSIRSRESLLAALAEGWNPTYLPFWGHRVPAEGSVGTSCFSQWYPARFELEGVAYPTAEHFMMAEKARLFADSATEEQILHAPSPADAKRLGREVRNYVDRSWKEHRFQAVVRGNVAKFRQNPPMGAVLINSGESVIVEASPRDLIWESDWEGNIPMSPILPDGGARTSSVSP